MGLPYCFSASSILRQCIVTRLVQYPYSDERLQSLTDACSKATFGQGDKDVLDESYRRAGKLDFGKFSWSLRLRGLDAIIRDGLLPFEGDPGLIEFELYKLNVYGWS